MRSDGTLSLPFLGEVNVDGLTIEQAEQKVIEAYLRKEIIREEDYRIIVTLLRPRYERVLVVREDAAQSSVSFSNQGLIGFGSSTTISSGSSATGQVVELPAYENDVLNALARTGGLPGPDAVQEIVIYRHGRKNREERTQQPDNYEFPCDPQLNGGDVVRIPLEVTPGMPSRINPDHIILKTGDIVTVQAREPELYYTGGLIPSGEFQLPFDRDLSILEALLKARAPVVSGGLSTSNLNGSFLSTGIGVPSPSLVSVIRKTPGGSQVVIRIDLNEAMRDPRQNLLVQSEDVLIMQESEDEALTRYISNAVSFDFFFRYLDRQDASGAGSIVFP